MARILLFPFLLIFTLLSVTVYAEPPTADYALSAGDAVKIQVFQNPDLTVETRLNEAGNISYPLIGQIQIGGLTPYQAERKIAEALFKGGFVNNPQVTVVPLMTQGNQVAVLGQVNKPGRYALETSNLRVSDVIALAGGINTIGDDIVVIKGFRSGKPFQAKVDLYRVLGQPADETNLLVLGGDTIFVDRAPMYYIYGEVQRPGAFRVERNMTVMQALATGGGLTSKGTDRRLEIHRRLEDGRVQTIEPKLTDVIQANDTLFIRESLF